MEARREREKFFKEMDSEISGRNAKTVYRKDGVKLDPRLVIRENTEEKKGDEENGGRRAVHAVGKRVS